MIDLTDGRLDVSITVIELPTVTNPGATTFADLELTSNQFNTAFSDTGTGLSELGEHTGSDTVVRPGNNMIQPGGTIYMYFLSNTFSADRQGYTFTVNYVRISTSQVEYKPAGDYPVRDNSVAAVQFTQETFPTGAADSFAADGQLDGPLNGWVFHHITSDLSLIHI